MTIENLLNEAKKRLSQTSSDFLGAELLLAHALGITKESLITQSQQTASHEQETQFWSFFERFYAGEPVAYLTGKKEFFGLDFYVDKRVLIPRPETELLVEKVIHYAKKITEDHNKTSHHAPPIRILDVGTGSGCIAISVAKYCPNATITAIDISTEALEVAAYNIKKHQLESKINLHQSNLLENIDEPFDIIVANLPYIGERRFNFVSKEAQKYEPSIALFGGNDGLQLYRQLFTQLQQKTWQPKVILGEFGFLQGEEMRTLLNQFFKNWRIHNDLASIERMFVVACGGISL